jgi:hypothetical protein
MKGGIYTTLHMHNVRPTSKQHRMRRLRIVIQRSQNTDSDAILQPISSTADPPLSALHFFSPRFFNCCRLLLLGIPFSRTICFIAFSFFFFLFREFSIYLSISTVNTRVGRRINVDNAKAPDRFHRRIESEVNVSNCSG